MPGSIGTGGGRRPLTGHGRRGNTREHRCGSARDDRSADRGRAAVNARLPLFERAADYEACTDVLQEALRREPLTIFASSVMPNHWHFVVRPDADHQVSSFFRWLTLASNERHSRVGRHPQPMADSEASHEMSCVPLLFGTAGAGGGFGVAERASSPLPLREAGRRPIA
jgi:hypothetical protein